MYMGVFPEHMSIYQMFVWYLQRQKRISNPLELELQRVVSHHVCAGNGTWALWKSNSCSYLLSHLSRPSPLIICLDLNSYLWALCLHMYVCIAHVCLMTLEVKSSDSLELELGMIVSYYVAAVSSVRTSIHHCGTISLMLSSFLIMAF